MRRLVVVVLLSIVAGSCSDPSSSYEYAPNVNPYITLPGGYLQISTLPHQRYDGIFVSVNYQDYPQNSVLPVYQNYTASASFYNRLGDAIVMPSRTPLIANDSTLRSQGYINLTARLDSVAFTTTHWKFTGDNAFVPFDYSIPSPSPITISTPQPGTTDSIDFANGWDLYYTMGNADTSSIQISYFFEVHVPGDTNTFGQYVGAYPQYSVISPGHLRVLPVIEDTLLRYPHSGFAFVEMQSANSRVLWWQDRYGFVSGNVLNVTYLLKDE